MACGGSVIYQNMPDTDLLLIVLEHHGKLVVVKYRNASVFTKTICFQAVLLEQHMKNSAEGINRLLHLLGEGVHVESEKRLYM